VALISVNLAKLNDANVAIYAVYLLKADQGIVWHPGAIEFWFYYDWLAQFFVFTQVLSSTDYFMGVDGNPRLLETPPLISGY
jgi:hypothetical protein